MTEAGFGADLGAEKFFDIKCRKAGLNPAAAVIVATVRALKMHGGVAKDDLKNENAAAVAKGCDNLKRHLENVRKFGVPPVVAINRFITDTDKEIAEVMKAAESAGAKAFLCTHWADGGKGIEALARHVVDVADSGQAKFKPLYPDDMPLRDKVKTIATEIYRAADIACDASIEARFKELQDAGYGHLPVCMAKTQYSFSTDPNKRGAPTGHIVPIRELRLSAGAEFIVVITGDIMTMPGLPQGPLRQRHPPQRQGPDRGSVLTAGATEQHRGRSAARGEPPVTGRGSSMRVRQCAPPRVVRSRSDPDTWTAAASAHVLRRPLSTAAVFGRQAPCTSRRRRRRSVRQRAHLGAPVAARLGLRQHLEARGIAAGRDRQIGAGGRRRRIAVRAVKQPHRRRGRHEEADRRHARPVGCGLRAGTIRLPWQRRKARRSGAVTGGGGRP